MIYMLNLISNHTTPVLSAEKDVTTVTEILENVEETVGDQTSVIPTGTTLEEVNLNTCNGILDINNTVFRKNHENFTGSTIKLSYL